ncbi:MAG: TIGR03915 family putative DNA repair protein [Treponema sp.]|jgi:probable DNA metabolism protein|nr:TIGR03915 family putative DNA repair protein [Treponema sp.]
MSRSLGELFFLLENDDSSGYAGDSQEDLFGFSGETPTLFRRIEDNDIEIVTGLYSSAGISLPDPARRFYELSVNAFSAFVHAWMSELPIEKEMLNFGRRVIAAADRAGNGAERRAAERAAIDRGDVDTLTVLAAASKVQYEIHRLLGLLRFYPDKDIYTARCSPDHFVLPAMGEHFTGRFGETAWTVIDERRGLCLRRLPGERAKTTAQNDPFMESGTSGGDEWEKLFVHYHKTINNESRKNPELQRRFMPQRYWKYLPEM